MPFTTHINRGKSMKLKPFVAQGLVISGLCFAGQHLAYKKISDKNAFRRIDNFEDAAGIIESRMGAVRSCSSELDQRSGRGEDQRTQLNSCLDHKLALGEIRRSLHATNNPEIIREIDAQPTFARTAQEAQEIPTALENMALRYRDKIQEIRENANAKDNALWNLKKMLLSFGIACGLIATGTLLFSGKREEEEYTRRFLD